MSIEDVVVLIGLIVLLTGIYLWVGLPPTLVLAGMVMVSVGIRAAVVRSAPTTEGEGNQGGDGNG